MEASHRDVSCMDVYIEKCIATHDLHDVKWFEIQDRFTQYKKFHVCTVSSSTMHNCVNLLEQVHN